MDETTQQSRFSDLENYVRMSENTVKTIAYFPADPGYLGNEVFNLQHPTNVTGNLDRWVAFRDFLYQKGIELNTYDHYEDPQKVDVWLFIDPGRRAFQFMVENPWLVARPKILMLVEPPLINRRGWRYLRWYSLLFKVILTWRPELITRGGKYMGWHYPTAFNPAQYDHYKANSKKNVCMMIHSNKFLHIPGELYSLRRQIVEYFDKRGDELLDLYGFGWNDPTQSSPFFTPLYKGTVQDKWETFSQYQFVFCIDNSVAPGYITYDLFIAMSTGTVPIYLPMPDAYQYIPADTFVSFSDFQNDLDGLVQHLQEIVKSGAYEGYRERGLAFLNSKRYRPFTIQQFCEDVYLAIQRVGV